MIFAEELYAPLFFREKFYASSERKPKERRKHQMSKLKGVLFILLGMACYGVGTIDLAIGIASIGEGTSRIITKKNNK